MAKKGKREKIKLESSAGTGHLYDGQEQDEYAGQDRTQEIRSRCAKTRRVQRDETQVAVIFNAATLESEIH